MRDATLEEIWGYIDRFGITVRNIADRAKLEYAAVFAALNPPRGYQPPQSRLAQIAEAIGCAPA